MPWQKGKPRKPQIEHLKEIEKRIEMAASLSEEEKAAARAKAREHVMEKRKEKALDQYLQAAIKAEEAALEPAEAFEDFTVDLPEYTFRMVIDGVDFYHGVTYRIKFSKARSMADLQANAWAHQREIDGRRRMGDSNRRPEHQIISPTRPGRTNTSTNMRI